MIGIGIDVMTATITNGTALSGAVPLGAKTLTGLVMPSAWTAAVLTFQVSVDGGTTWVDMIDIAGVAISCVVGINRYIPVDVTIWRGINNVRVRSGTSLLPVNQAADAIVSLVVRSL